MYKSGITSTAVKLEFKDHFYLTLHIPFENLGDGWIRWTIIFLMGAARGECAPTDTVRGLQLCVWMKNFSLVGRATQDTLTECMVLPLMLPSFLKRTL